jgi:hypothetical protein
MSELLVHQQKEKEKEKDCHMGNGKTTRYVLSTVRRETAFKECGDSRCGSRAILFRRYDHRLAILVHQGNDPTLPYQALVIRKSAMLFPRVCPLGT